MSDESDIPDFAAVGRPTGEIEVKISYRIIQLFSEGLYSSPNKAIEELVSNSFDAGAENVHVIISPDLTDSDATIAVVDDGEGMDGSGLQNHWIIGQSQKRQARSAGPGKRKPIGKFGIGKLATYVLANRLSHICKSKGRYYATSMDYGEIPETQGEAGTLEERVSLPLRELTENEAKAILAPWITGEKAGFQKLSLFSDSSKSWTVAIMSELKDMVQEIKPGRLKWVLSTAMPIRNDFNLFLTGEQIKSSKLRGKKIGAWQIGKDLKKLQKPASQDFEATIMRTSNPLLKYGLSHPQLGRVTGRIELYEDLLTQGKSADLGRSWGIFVYVRGRLVNADDPYFGISSNKLRHGTLSRFRLEINIDKLDDELRSSRETVRESSQLTTARNLMEAMFNFARRKHEEHTAAEAEGRRATKRVADTPARLTSAPLRSLIEGTLDGSHSPSLTRCPEGLTKKQRDDFLAELDSMIDSEEGPIKEIVHAALGQHVGIAVYDAQTRILQINSLHPFVAYFGDEFSDKDSSLPLELLATSEVLLEASMYEHGLKRTRIDVVMNQRDQLLRELARSVGRRNALMLSQDLQNASSNQDELEEEVIAAFDSLGFDTVPQSTKRRIGIAQAFGGGRQAKPYNVALSVNAKLKPGTQATYKSLLPSRIRKERDDGAPPCGHAIVVVVDFPRQGVDRTKIVNEEKESRTESGKTITYIHVTDFAKLVRLAPAKRIGLPELQKLFKECITPEECKEWVSSLEKSKPSTAPYREILETIYEEQKQMPGQDIEFSVVEVILRKQSNVVIEKSEIVSLCNALQRIVPEYVCATEDTVAIRSSPTRILAAFNATIKEYPEDVQSEKKMRTSKE